MAIETAEQIRARTQAGAPQQTPVAWRYDPEYEQASNAVQTGLAKLGAAKNTSLQRTTEDFDTATRAASTQNETNVNALQNKLANQGIGYSGVNVQEQGRLSQNYTDTVAALTQGQKRSKEDIESNAAEQEAGYNAQLQQAEIDKAGRQTTYEKEQAAIAAQAQAAKDTADQQRAWMADLQSRLTQLTQPAPTSTGQMETPKATVQQALAQLPPPAAKTPQQQATESGADIRSLQSILQSKGFSPGPIDGVMGKKTQLALAQWKQSIGLPATADITPEIWAQLSAPKPAIGGPRMQITGPSNLAQTLNQRNPNNSIPNIMAMGH